MTRQTALESTSTGTPVSGRPGISRTDLVASGCQGKFAFPTWALAEKAARRSKRRGVDNAHCYRCKWCHGLHVGNSVRPKSKR